MAENQSDEVQESKASQSVKIGVLDIDGVRMVISHTISLMPSIWRILDNLLIMMTAEPKSSASSHGRQKTKVVKWKGLNPNLQLHHMAENQSDEVQESKASQSVKIDVLDIDGVRMVISHTISLMPSIWRILDNLQVMRTAELKSSASSHGRKPK
ncbi:Hypothetical predicted protein [Mytilus galloprovincialis]|uniref:Uncharacterized protein n=1 Tax=Mytilus galloprovincialis TaxID=29158 RepID=A0A8B6CU76_MYTGA|nr:Hypothetical predicted protein [Mytilus galloprovincialis]